MFQIYLKEHCRAAWKPLITVVALAEQQIYIEHCLSEGKSKTHHLDPKLNLLFTFATLHKLA